MDEQDSELDAMRGGTVPGTLDYIALGAALVPFFLSFRSSESSSMETTVTGPDGEESVTRTETASFRDPVAIAGGAVAIIMALVLLLQFGRVPKEKRAVRLGIAAVSLLLGGYHLVVRSGLVG